jgi:hypothetical protein
VPTRDQASTPKKPFIRRSKSRRRNRQKPRLLPAATKPMSAEIAAGNFGQSNQST